MGLRTEDQVRNQAGMTLGFIDAEMMLKQQSIYQA